MTKKEKQGFHTTGESWSEKLKNLCQLADNVQRLIREGDLQTATSVASSIGNIAGELNMQVRSFLL